MTRWEKLGPSRCKGAGPWREREGPGDGEKEERGILDQTVRACTRSKGRDTWKGLAGVGEASWGADSEGP